MMNDESKLESAYGTGIAGTVLGAVALAGLWGGDGNGFNLFGNRSCRKDEEKVSALESKVAELQAMRYTDQVGIDLYRTIIQTSNANDAKLTQSLAAIYERLIGLEKETALNKQATIYENVIMNNKVDCCCDKMNLITAHNQRINGLADASIVSYVNSNFLPGTLYLPATSITPAVTTA